MEIRIGRCRKCLYAGTLKTTTLRVEPRRSRFGCQVEDRKVGSANRKDAIAARLVSVGEWEVKPVGGT